MRKLIEIATELECTVAQLALAWCLKNKNVSSVITGISSVYKRCESRFAGS